MLEVNKVYVVEPLHKCHHGAGIRKWPLQRGDRCGEVAIIEGSTVLYSIILLPFSGMAILVGLSFFFLLVAEYMPETSEAVPLIGMYYTVTMIQVSCAFFMTCWVLRFHHQNPTEGEVPEWTKVNVLVSRFVLV